MAVAALLAVFTSADGWLWGYAQGMRGGQAGAGAGRRTALLFACAAGATLAGVGVARLLEVWVAHNLAGVMAFFLGLYMATLVWQARGELPCLAHHQCRRGGIGVMWDGVAACFACGLLGGAALCAPIAVAAAEGAGVFWGNCIGQQKKPLRLWMQLAPGFMVSVLGVLLCCGWG